MGTDRDDPVVWWLAGADADDLLAQLSALDPGVGVEGPAPGAGPARLAIVEPDERKVRLAGRLLAKGAPWRGRSDIWFVPAGTAAEGGKVAFVFPGVEPAFAAGDVDVPALGRRLGLEAPEIRTDSVAHQTASIYRLGIFLDLALRRLGVEPDVVAGHSVGEWSGTVAAGLVPHAQADELIRAVELDAVQLPDVDFAALAAGAEAVWEVVGDLDGVDLSHDNSPSQAIICGPPAAIDAALARLREANILGYKLPFQSGFHTPAIAPMIEPVRELAGGLPFGPGDVPMWSATVAAPYPSGRDEIIDLHLRHLVEPVRFRPLVERLYDDAGVRVFVQVGIGSLTGFIDDTLDGRDHASVPLLTAKRSALAQMHRALTALWVEGVAVRPDVLAAGSPAPAGEAEAVPAGPEADSDAAGPDEAGPAGEAEAVPAAVGAVAAAGPSTGGGVAGQTLLGAADLLSAAARASQDVVDALAARLVLPAGPAPSVPAPLAAPATTAAPSGPAPVPVAAPAPAGGTGRGEGGWPTGKVTLTRRLSLETMPETIDHTLYLQPEGWGDVADLFPIVAMTTQIQLLQDIVAEHAGGRDVVEVFGIRNFRWLDLSEPVDVPITIVPKGEDVLNVSLGGYCRANVRVGEHRPAPRYERAPLTNERPTKHTAQDLWDLRLMFHGPRFRGIDALGPTGDDGMLGRFTHLDTPGSLLDNLGKLIAYWVIDQRGVGEGALPIGVERIEFFGPPPRPGDEVRCDVRILELQRDLVRGDGVLVLPDGRIICKVEGWASVVFHLDEKMEPLYHRPSANFAVEPQPGGWTVQRERWLTGAGRDLSARRFTSRAEREAYERMNLLDQRRHLLELVTLKDTVRQWLWDRFGVPSYPVQVVPVPDGDRRFRVESPVIPDGRDPRITLSSPYMHSDALAVMVAILGDGEYRDIEARQVPEGADPEAVAREAAEALAARNPGARIAWVAEPENAVPVNLADVPEPPPFAVAWTE